MPARKKRPSTLTDARYRNRSEPPEQRDPIGNCPDRLTELQRTAWLEIVSQAAPGVLSRSDRLGVEQAAILLAKSWTDAKFTASEGSRLDKLLLAFGLLPTGRMALQLPLVQTPPTPNPFDEFR